MRLPVCHDWYGKEAKEAGALEKGKRLAAHTLFRERVEGEARQGGRMALIADLAIPDLPSGEATIVATHLENRCTPTCRCVQMKVLPAEVKQDENPLRRQLAFHFRGDPERTLKRRRRTRPIATPGPAKALFRRMRSVAITAGSWVASS